MAAGYRLQKPAAGALMPELAEKNALREILDPRPSVH